MFKITVIPERDLLQLADHILYGENKIYSKLFYGFYKIHYGSLTNLFEALFSSLSNHFVKINSEYSNLSLHEYNKIINIFSNIIKDIDINKIHVVDVYDLLFTETNDFNIKINNIFYSTLYDYIDEKILDNKDKVFEDLYYIINNLYSYIENHLLHLDNDLDYLYNYYIYIDNINNNLIFITFLEQDKGV